MPDVKGGFRKRNVWLFVFIAGIVFAALTVSRLRSDAEEFEATNVIRTGVPGVREHVHVTLNARSGKSYRIMPTVELWDDNRWKISSAQHAEFDAYILNPSTFLTIRVPAEKARWRVRLDAEEVDSEYLNRSHCFEKKPVLRDLLERVGILAPGGRKSVHYLETDSW